MIELLKKWVYKILVKLSANKWTSPEKKHILIQTGRYFNRERWLSILSEKLNDDKGQYEIAFTSDRFNFAKLFPRADYCFCFSISRYLDVVDIPLRMIYLGTRGIDGASLKNLPAGVKLFTVPPVAAEAIAEYVLLSVLMLHRRIQFTVYNAARKIWSQREIIQPYTRLDSLKVGIAGYGNIGKKVAIMLKNNGIQVFAWDKVAECIDEHLDCFYQKEELPEMLNSIDILVITLPLTDETKGLFNFDKFSLLKPGAGIINVARGEIIEEKGLIKALKKKLISGAVLDVFTREPLPSSSKLWIFKNIMITPHIAGNINLFAHEIMEDFINKVTDDKLEN